MSTHISRLCNLFATDLYNLGFESIIRQVGLLKPFPDDDAIAPQVLSYIAGYAHATKDACQTLANIGVASDQQLHKAAAARAMAIAAAFSMLVLALNAGVGETELQASCEACEGILRLALIDRVEVVNETSIPANLN